MYQENLDSFIKQAIDSKRIIVDTENGKVYKTREKTTNKTVEPYEVMGRIRRGYRAINVSINNIEKPLSIHRIVWIAQYGIPINGLVINHKNFDREDNRIKNLEMVTPTENLKHSIKHKRLKVVGEGNGSSKLTQAQVDAIRKEYIPYKVTKYMLAEKYGVSHVTIAKIVCGISWKHSFNHQIRWKAEGEK